MSKRKTVWNFIKKTYNVWKLLVLAVLFIIIVPFFEKNRHWGLFYIYLFVAGLLLLIVSYLLARFIKKKSSVIRKYSLKTYFWTFLAVASAALSFLFLETGAEKFLTVSNYASAFFYAVSLRRVLFMKVIL